MVDATVVLRISSGGIPKRTYWLPGGLGKYSRRRGISSRTMRILIRNGLRIRPLDGPEQCLLAS